MYTNIFDGMLNNLVLVGAWFLIFCTCVLANIIAKTSYNTLSLSQSFDWKKFLLGIVKMLNIGVSLALLSCAGTAFVTMIDIFPIDIPDGTIEAINVAVVIILFVGGTVKYFTQAIETNKKAIDNIGIVESDDSGK